MNFRSISIIALALAVLLLGTMMISDAVMVSDLKTEIIRDGPHVITSGQKLSVTVVEEEKIVENPQFNTTAVATKKPDSNAVYIGQRLQIRIEDHNVSDDVAEKLMTRRQKDNATFEGIIRLSAYVVENPDHKELLARELLEMDEGFISRMCDIPEEQAKRQANDYVKTVETGIPIKIRVDDEKIEMLYRNKSSLDIFMEDLWRSFDVG